jgi:hypothetical protein
MDELISLLYPGFHFRRCFAKSVATFTLTSFYIQYMQDSPRGQNCYLGSVLRVLGVEVLTAVVMKGSIFLLPWLILRP